MRFNQCKDSVINKSTTDSNMYFRKLTRNTNKLVEIFKNADKSNLQKIKLENEFLFEDLKRHLRETNVCDETTKLKAAVLFRRIKILRFKIYSKLKTLALLILFIAFGCNAQTLEKQIRINDVVYDVPLKYAAKLNDSIMVYALNDVPFYPKNFIIGQDTLNSNPIKLKVTKNMSFKIEYVMLPGYDVALGNTVYMNERLIEFDVYIKTNTLLTVTSYQGALSFNQAIKKPAAQLTFSYIPNSSELINVPRFAIGINSNLLTFASGPGIETILGQKKIGRFKLQSDLPFNILDLNLAWVTVGNVNTIITGFNYQNITPNAQFLPAQETSILIQFD